MTQLREEYSTKIKLQLDELNAKVDVMEAKMQLARAEVRSTYHGELVKLRLQSDQASEKLAQMQASGEEAWDQMVLEMDKVRDAFVHSFNYFKAQI